MKSIVFICRRYCIGEAWTNRLLCYAKGFASQGFRVKLLFLIPDKFRTNYKIEIPGVEVVDLWRSDGFISKIHRLFSYIKNKTAIRDYISNGDICFMMDAGGLYVREINKSNKNVKIVIETTEHPKIRLRGINHFFYRSFIKSIKAAEKVCVISKSLQEFYVNDIGIDENRVCIINMFVDPIRFEGLTKQAKSKYIAYCGSVGIVKDGVDVLIKAFAKFKKSYPDYHLEIYGTGLDDVMNQLLMLTTELQLNESVMFVGKVSPEDMPQKLFDSKILALARPDNLQNRNGFPTKLGEYLATGNPVVVTAVGEIPLFIKDRENGYLALPGDVDSFALKLSEAANDLENNLVNIGDNGKLLINKEFSYIENISKLINSL